MASETEEEEIQLWQTVAPVEFAPKLESKSDAQALLITARQGMGFFVAGGQLAHALLSRATHVLLDYSSAACAIRYQVDGNWEQLPPLDRETGDAMLYAIKQLCLMNPADRRGAQRGKIELKLGRDKYQMSVQSQGIASGERVMIKLEPEKLPFEKLSDLGMRDKMIEQFKEQLNGEGNITLISATKGEGLTTLWTVALNVADRLIRDFQSFEPAENPEPEIINVGPNLFGGETGKSELEVVNKMVLREPDVLVFPNPPQPESLKVCLDQVETAQRQVIHRGVADNALTALLTFLNRYPELRQQIVKFTGAVVHQRLVRRLCDQCKVGFEPPPKLLAQLGIPQGRIAMLYQPFVPPPIEQQVDEKGQPAPIPPCPACNGRGYLGRIGIFELLQPGPELKKALTQTDDAGQLMAVAKSEGHRGTQAEAILTVARGLTSLEEVRRVFSKR